MFGGRIARAETFAVLSGLTAVTDVLANGAQGLVPNRTVPAEVQLPACLYYVESAPYDEPINAVGSPTVQMVRLVVRFAAEGYDDSAILPAAQAAFTALHGHSADRSGFHLVFSAAEEWPLNDYVDLVDGAAVPTVELGTIFTVEVLAAD